VGSPQEDKAFRLLSDFKAKVFIMFCNNECLFVLKIIQVLIRAGRLTFLIMMPPKLCPMNKMGRVFSCGV
jgi:hypothetical protein